MKLEGQTPFETLGSVLGAIPVLSTFVGLIKFIIYSGLKKGAHERAEMAQTAGKIDEKLKDVSLSGSYELLGGRTKPMDLSSAEERMYSRLCKNSLLQMIPFYNIWTAMKEPVLQGKLHHAEKLQNLDEQIAYVREKYDVSSIGDAAKAVFMGKVLIAIDNLDFKNIDQDAVKYNWVLKDNNPHARRGTWEQFQSISYIHQMKESLYESCFQSYNPAVHPNPIALVRTCLEQKIAAIDAHETSRLAALPALNRPDTGLTKDLRGYESDIAQRENKQAFAKNLLTNMRSQLDVLNAN